MRTSSINFVLFAVIACLYLYLTSFSDEIYGMSSTFLWQLSSMMLCIFRFFMLNFIVNRFKIRNTLEVRHLVAEKWFVISNNAVFERFDKSGGLMFFSAWGSILLSIFASGFLVFMYLSFHPELANQIFYVEGKYLFFVSIGFLISMIFTLLLKTKIY